jgi:hypothetical protein
VWPQCWDLQGPRGLEQRDLRNLNLGDLKKGPNGRVSPTPQKKSIEHPVEGSCKNPFVSIIKVIRNLTYKTEMIMEMLMISSSGRDSENTIFYNQITAPKFNHHVSETVAAVLNLRYSQW